MPPDQVTADTDAGSGYRTREDRPQPPTPNPQQFSLGLTDPKQRPGSGSLLPSGGEGTDGPVAPAHTPPGVPRAGSPGKELPQPAASEASDTVSPQGPGRHGPAWESGLAPELLAFQPAGGLPLPRSQNGHQGGPGGAERRTSCSHPFSRRSLDFQWAGSELIPVTMHSGTLTTNLIENILAIKAQNGKPPSPGGYLTNCLTDKYIKTILKPESCEVKMKKVESKYKLTALRYSV